jgi:hypothetical protein
MNILINLLWVDFCLGETLLLIARWRITIESVKEADTVNRHSTGRSDAGWMYQKPVRPDG